MFEFHGWCTLRESTLEPNRDDLRRAVEEVTEFIDQLRWPSGFCQIRPFNGEYFVHLGGYQNRPREVSLELDQLFAKIAQAAPGSYGLLYSQDDEDPVWNNVWRVKVMARGEVRDGVDTFLSPCTPTIED